MADILLIGETRARMDAYALALDSAGHEVELCETAHAARDRLFGDRTDLVVIDVTSPDGGSGLLCVQAHAAWPDTPILALAPFRDFSRTKLGQMGLWAPTEILVHPVSTERLVQKVAQMQSGTSGAGRRPPRRGQQVS